MSMVLCLCVNSLMFFIVEMWRYKFCFVGEFWSCVLSWGLWVVFFFVLLCLFFFLDLDYFCNWGLDSVSEKLKMGVLKVGIEIRFDCINGK